MTEAQLYLDTLHIIDKQSIPTIRVDDFNTFANDAIIHLVQGKYVEEYDVTQNITDDLQVLSRNAIYTDAGVVDFSNNDIDLFNNDTNNDPNRTLTFEGELFDLPSNYMHLTNCVVKITDNECGIQRTIRAKKFNADNKASVTDNSYLKPSRERVYYYIRGTRIELLFGDQNASTLDEISIEYLKFPDTINLQPSEITPDTSSEIEFNDVTVHKIKDELVHRLLELVEHPVRQQTRIPLDQKIH